ncbi:MAG TPA: hypothetical protein VF462_04735 [Micromonosporaceae bacterium]
MNGLGGDGWPEGRAPEPVPGLPPEWGPIVIPDDPAELAAEAEAVRRELRLVYGNAAGFRVPPQRYPAGQRFHRGARPSGLAAARPAVVLMLVAVLTTLASLFAVSWQDPQNPQRQPTNQRPAVGNSAVGRLLPALELVDEKGRAVPLRSLLPAVIIVVDDCTCTDQIASVAATAPAPVTVAAVTSGRTAPQPAPAPSVRALADPASGLRGLLPSGPPSGQAAALLVTRSGQIVRVLPSLDKPEDYRADLEALADR